MPGTLENICRLCLSTEGLMFPIFQDKEVQGSSTFRYKILTCADIEVYADDGLPSMICHNCVHMVEKFYVFRNKCEKADAALRCHFQEIQKSNETNHFSEVSNSMDMKFETSEEVNGWNTTQSIGEGSITKFSVKEYIETIVASQKQFLDSGSPVLTCTVCFLNFDQDSNLVQHLKSQHPSVQIFSCNTCDVSYSSVSDIRKHMYEHHNEMLNCKQCDKVFRHERNLEEHKLWHEKKNFPCKFCLLAFCSTKLLESHEALHQEKICKFCCEEFATKSMFEEHSLVCKKVYDCSFCEKNFMTIKDMIEHVNINHENPVVEKCDDRNLTNLKISEKYKCEMCHMSFSSEELLNTHAAEHMFPLKCKFCLKVFNLKSSLRRHEKSHSSLKPYQCKYCAKRFKDSSTCIVHTRTHTGEQPFECKDCHKHFRQLANLKMHTYRHHKKNRTENDGLLARDSNTSSSSNILNTRHVSTTEETNEIYQDQNIIESDLQDYSLEQNRVYDQIDLQHLHMS